jgi:predicted acyl esterase
MGRNSWIYASNLQQIESAPMKLELDLTGAVAGDVTRSGSLRNQPPATAAKTTLISDPRFLPPREGIGVESPQWLTDQHDTYTDLRSQVVWHSAPFPAEVVLAGRPKLHLRIASDQPDADLRVELHEVLPDGNAIRLSQSALRLRYRRGGVAAVPMVPGKPETIDVPALSFFARSIAKGSRLRLVVNAGSSFRWQRNTNTGGDLASEPLSASRVAKITIMTGPNSRSILELPQPEAELLKRSEAESKRNNGTSKRP